MASTSPSWIWFMRLAYVLLAIVIVFFHLLPLNTLPSRWAPPDLILAFAMAWSIRRPDFIPLPLLAAVFLLADLLLQRPPGLWALLGLTVCTFLRSRLGGQQELPFLAEWSAVSIVLIAASLLNRIVLNLFAVEQSHIALMLVQLIMTLITYPLVVLVSQSLFGVRRLSASDLDALGNRP